MPSYNDRMIAHWAREWMDSNQDPEWPGDHVDFEDDVQTFARTLDGAVWDAWTEWRTAKEADLAGARVDAAVERGEL